MDNNPEEEKQGSQEQIIIIPSEASIKSAQSSSIKSLLSDNNNSKLVERWRKFSRCVVYADMVVTFAAFVQCGLLLALVIWGLINTHQQKGFEGVGATESAVLALSMFQFACHIRGFWLDCKLHTATNPLTPSEEALEKANLWPFIQIFRIGLAIALGVVTSTSGLSIGTLNFLWVLPRMIFLYIVHRFISEYEENYEATTAEVQCCCKNRESF